MAKKANKIAPKALKAAAMPAAKQPAAKVTDIGVKLANALKAAAMPAAEKPAAKLPKQPAAEPAKPPAAKKLAEPAKPKADTLALHLNKTGRLCFLRGAAARLTEAGFAIDEQYFMALAIDKGLIRLEPKLEASADTVEVRDGGGRPYVSLTRQLKPWGFDGSRAIDIPNVKPYGKGGFEFRLS